MARSSQRQVSRHAGQRSRCLVSLPTSTIHVGPSKRSGSGSSPPMVRPTELGAWAAAPANRRRKRRVRACRLAMRNASAGPARSRSSVVGKRTKTTSIVRSAGTLERLVDGADGGEPPRQHRLGVRHDVARGQRAPSSFFMSKVRVASVTESTSKPSSDAWRVVVSQHCSVRMPATMSRPMPRWRSQIERPVPASALCRSLTTSRAGAYSARPATGLTCPDARDLGLDPTKLRGKRASGSRS